MSFDSNCQLSEHEFDQLKSQVLDIRKKAYCPYSKFRVGCTILTDDGVFISGVNVENASYGAAICAERTAITKAVSEGYQKFKVIAISADTPTPISPCGICRQVIREFGKDTPIYLFNFDGSRYLRTNIEKLLPYSFGPEDLDDQKE